MRRLFLIAFLLCPLSWAQTPDLTPGRDDLAEPLLPTIAFSFDLPGGTPAQYAISVDRSGRAAYTSHGRPLVIAETTPGDPYTVRFLMSDALRDRIFVLAEKANRFRQELDYRKGNISPQLGRKELAYADGGDRWAATYTWSQHPAVQELTRIFQGISNTFEAGRRLEHLRRHDRLGIDAELRRMEELAKHGQLLEVHVISSLLRELAADPGLMNVSRQRVEKLLRTAPERAAAAP